MNQKLKKISLALSLTFVLSLGLSACSGGDTKTTSDTTKAASAAQSDSSQTGDTDKTSKAETEANTSTDAGSGEEIYIPVVSKGFQHQFWQVVKKGAEAAAKEFNVRISFEGPASESDIANQVKMLDSALAQQPAAICLAALSTESVMDQLEAALEKNIPVIGFDSGVPNAPEGAIHANASTDNSAAGALGATSMFEAIKDKIATGKVGEPVRIGVVSQDATSESVTNRTSGFIDEMVKLIEDSGVKEVSVIGHDKFKAGVSEKEAKVVIIVSIGTTTSASDLKAAANAILNFDNVIGIYGSNESASNGILDASDEGSELPDNEIIAVGFDAGARQKAAVEAGYFYGSITQDPFNIGYMAVKLAYQAYKGEKVEDVDTGAKFYTAANMKDADIAELLYD